MTLQQFSLSWEKHQSNICNGFRDFQRNGDFVDMTLAAEGHHVKVHKMMMGVASTYFRTLIDTAETKHPIVYLHNISYETLISLLEFIYTGEVAVQEDKLVDFINTAQKLEISGLLDMKNEQNYQTSKPVGLASPKDQSSGSEHKKVIDSLFLEQVGMEHDVGANTKPAYFAVDPLASAGRASEPPHLRQLNAEEEVSPTNPIYVKTAQGRFIRRKTAAKIGDTTVKSPSSSRDNQKTSTFEEILQRVGRKRSATSPIGGMDEDRSLSPITTVDEVDPDMDDEYAVAIQVKKEPSDLDKLRVKGLQYTLSNRGAYQLILNRFIYNLYNKARSDAYRWRCVEYRDNRCLACVITNDGVLVRRINMHNHVFHDKKILAKIKKNIVFKTLDELDEVKQVREEEALLKKHSEISESTE